jgi:hypothetical protein
MSDIFPPSVQRPALLKFAEACRRGRMKTGDIEAALRLIPADVWEGEFAKINSLRAEMDPVKGLLLFAEVIGAGQRFDGD